MLNDMLIVRRFLAFFIIALAGIFMGCSGGATEKDPALKDPALEGARDAADLFLHTLRNDDGSSAYTLLSKDYRERLPEEERNSKKMNVAVVDGKPVAEWKRGAGKLSESKEQATFEGIVQTKDGTEHSYRLVMVKEDGAWRVDLFSVKKQGS